MGGKPDALYRRVESGEVHSTNLTAWKGLEELFPVLTGILSYLIPVTARQSGQDR